MFFEPIALVRQSGWAIAAGNANVVGFFRLGGLRGRFLVS